MRRTLPFVLAAAISLAACSSRADDAAPAAAGGEATVEIVDFVYTPETIEVTAGTTVTWINRDGFAHTVTEASEAGEQPRFDGELGDADTFEGVDTEFSHQFEEPGTYTYICTFHPSMEGTVEVTGA